MVKKLTKRLKNVELEITFAEPKEYDTVKGIDIQKKKNRKRKKFSTTKLRKLSRSKK